MAGSPQNSVWKKWRVTIFRTWRMRGHKWLSDHDWQIVGTLWILALGLGYLGFATYAARHDQSNSIWDNFYLTMQLFTMESGSVQGIDNWSLGVARFLAPVAALYTAITALALVFREQLQILRIRFISDHVVICGLGRQGLILATRFLERGDRVVVIERDQGNERISQCRDNGAIVIIGNASDSEILLKAGVHRAEYLISVCGDDGINAEVAVDARTIAAGRRRSPLKCVVKIEDLELCHLLEGQEVAMGNVDTFRLEFFNTYLRGAKALLADHPAFDQSDERIPHLLVAGVGRMGESLVVQAARDWRKMHPQCTVKLRITLIDKAAREKKKLLLLKNPLLERVCDLTARENRSSEYLASDFLFDDQGRCDVTRAYVLLDDDSRCLSAAMVLLKRLRGHSVPIIVRLSHEGGLGTLLHEFDANREGFGSLYAFGLVEKTCRPELVLPGTHEVLAQALHSQYVELRASAGHAVLPDPTTPAWEDLSENVKEAFRRQADQIGALLKAAGCTIEASAQLDAHFFEFTPQEVEALARKVHAFQAEEVRSGRSGLTPGSAETLGLDPQSAQVGWDALPDHVRELYRSLIRELPASLAKVDFQIYRLTRRHEAWPAALVPRTG